MPETVEDEEIRCIACGESLEAAVAISDPFCADHSWDDVEHGNHSTEES